ncbi:uncharacterized protein JCM6883_004393 [Sporobolomyces salmoneus]|uniref:uncharacterized protein n=1 Tax=Sporobolomyces salmoneus TaxID=183962 RepID=UPI00317BB182
MIERTLKDYENPATERLNDLKQDYNLDEDFVLAENLDEFLPALNKFVGMVKIMANLGIGGFTRESYRMIACHHDVVSRLFFDARSRTQEVRVLLYDIKRRKTLNLPQRNASANRHAARQEPVSEHPRMPASRVSIPITIFSSSCFTFDA